MFTFWFWILVIGRYAIMFRFGTRFFGPKGGSYGNKILYKNLVDGEILCLGIISAYLYMLFYAGEIQNQIAEGWKWQRIFS